MSSPRWLVLSFAAAIAAAFGACNEPAETSTTTTTQSGGAGGTTIITTTTTTSSEGEAGIVCNGMSSTVPKGDCDALQQDCPAGQTCRPLQDGTKIETRCTSANGLKTAGEDCYGSTECSAGLFCIGGKCSPVCCRDNAEPCAGGICNLSVQFGSYTMFFCHYAPTCDLLTENACEPGLECHIEDVTQGLATCSEPSGDPSPDLGECEYLNDCPHMEQCHTALGSSVCRFYCWPDAPEGTPAGLGGCPVGQGCFTKYAGSKIDYGVPGLGLCFPDGSGPDAGPDGGDAGDDGGVDASSDGGGDASTDGGGNDGGGSDGGTNDGGTNDGGTNDGGTGGAGPDGGTGGTAGAGGLDGGGTAGAAGAAGAAGGR